MNIDELRSLDFSDIGGWSVAAKAILIAILCMATLGAGYWFDTKDQVAKLQRLQTTEADLKSTFETKYKKAANLEAYKKQLKEMKESFGAMLKQLPSKTEVAELLIDISQTGLASGLEFELFKPEGERPIEFYAELPIKLRVTGTYHEFGNFVSGVAALPRIVTIHDFSILPATKPDKSGGSLIMEATAKTYRYLDEEEQAALSAQQSKTAQKK